MTDWPDDDVILYDGVCIFCSRWVRFVATRDIARRFRFTAIQSPYGTRLAQALGIDPDDPDTNAVVARRRGLVQIRCRANGAELAAGLAMDTRVVRCPEAAAQRASTVSSRGTAIGFSGSTTNASCPTRRCGRG